MPNEMKISLIFAGKLTDMRTSIIGEIITKEKYRFIDHALMAELIEDTLIEAKKRILTPENY
jgi:hypothetical protein